MCTNRYHQCFSEKQYRRVSLLFCVSNFLWIHFRVFRKERAFPAPLHAKYQILLQIIILDKVLYTIMPEPYDGATKLSIETRYTDKCTCLHCVERFSIRIQSVFLHKIDFQTSFDNVKSSHLLSFWLPVCSTSTRLFIKGCKAERRPSLLVTEPLISRHANSCDQNYCFPALRERKGDHKRRSFLSETISVQAWFFPKS